MAPDMQQLHDDVKVLHRALRALDERLGRLEKRGGAANQPQNAGAPPYLRMASDAHPQENAARPRVAVSGGVENKITGKVFVIVGVVSLLFGISFFFKYLFENNIIGITGRIILGVIAGMLFLVLGHYLSGKQAYRTYSFFISGGGLAVLYLSIYSAFNFYFLISQSAAFVIMILITALGIALSLISNAPTLAAVALLGGYLTPFLVSSGVDRQVALFTYIFILNASFVLTSYFKKWHVLYILSFAGTYVTYAAWHIQFYETNKLGTTMLFLTLFYVAFLIAPFLVSVFKKRLSGIPDVVLSVVNAAVYFGLSYALLKPDYESTLGFFFVLAALVNVFGAYFMARTHAADRHALYSLAGIGLVLLTVAIPIQFTGVWITMAWAVEAVALLWIGFLLSRYHLRVFSFLVFLISFIRLFAFDRRVDSLTDFTPFLNERFAVFVVVFAACFLGAYAYYHHKTVLRHDERWLPGALLAAGHFLVLFVLSAEIIDWYEKKIISANLLAAPQRLPVNRPLSGFGVEDAAVDSLKNTRNMILSLLWILYAGFLMVLGFVAHARLARIFSLLLFAVVIIKVFLFDVSFLSDLYRIVSFIALGVILLIISFLFYHYKDKVKAFLS